MTRRGLAIATGLAVFTAAHPAPAAGQADGTHTGASVEATTNGQAGALPRIQVEGNRFVDPDGRTMVLRGFSFSDPDRLERNGMWNRALFREARVGWNANVVRLPVHPRAWRERGPEAYLSLLDEGIRWAEEVGLYVIIDWHTIGNPMTELFQSEGYITTRTETLRFWETVAARYRDRPAVAFYELWNEPTRGHGSLGEVSWSEHRAFMEEVTAAIRVHAPSAVVLVAGFDWAYDLTEPAADPVDAANVAYVTHPYPMKRPEPWEPKWQEDWGFLAERFPVMATELGFMAADQPGAHNPVIADTSYGERIIDFFEARGISWIAWVFDPVWSPQLIEDWEFTPTVQGRFFRSRLRELNPVPDPPAPSPDSPGTMHTSGRHIYTAAGERVVLRGVNEMFAWAEDPEGEWVMGQIARTGANAIRIVTTLETDPADLDALIGEAIAHGMIPIPECHSATGRWDRLDLCVDYWARPDVAAVLRRHEEWVLLNIANEVGDRSVTAEAFVDGYRRAITRIRDAGIRAPLVVDGVSWGRDHRIVLDQWAPLNEHDPRHSVIASVHTYWVGTEAERKGHYRAIIDRITEDEIPFIIGEGPTPTGWDCSPSPYRWALSHLDAHDVGWLAWSWGVVDNGDCNDPARYDMTHGGRYGDWETDAGRLIAVDHSASIQNTSRRPCSIPQAGPDCVRPGSDTARQATGTGVAHLSGPAMQYHPTALTFQGPQAAETGEPNPFRDYRLVVTFEHEATGDRLRVPGYFAADGNAAESGATAGDRWRVQLTPHRAGAWTYEASFRAGEDVALTLSEAAGRPAAFDGATGRFTVAPTDKGGRDFRGRGMLRYVGEHYLRFDNGEWFLKGGADSPETLLAYADFDGTRSMAEAGVQRPGEAATAGLKGYEAHVADWREGDPTWRNGRGKGLIGALNYLAGEGLNAFSFLTMNVDGDGRNVWPWIEPDVRDRYDVSKLAQWERVFGHADRLGLYLHFKTQETENDRLLDGGELGPERKLYYRELIARFGHHLALNWNLGEENDIWEELDDLAQQRVRAYARWIRDLDPYDHHVVIHSYPSQHVEVYEPLLGDPALTGISLQTHWNRVYEDTRLWRTASRSAGRKWVVANDEQGDASTGLTPDGPGNNHDALRKQTLWGNLMAGGAGVEFYFGYEYPHNDLDAEDYRSRDRFWDYVRNALRFFDAYVPYWRMEPRSDLTDGRPWVLAQPGEVYVVYLPEGGEAGLHLADPGTVFSVRWYDPRTGGELRTGTLERVTAPETGDPVSLGSPPGDDGEDWVALVQRTSPGGPP